MTTIESVEFELRAIREFMAQIADRRLGRHELAERLGISVATLDRRVKAGSVPLPINGKWPLSVIVQWEMEQRKAKA